MPVMNQVKGGQAWLIYNKVCYIYHNVPIICHKFCLIQTCITSVCGVLVFTWVSLQLPNPDLHYLCVWCFSVYLGKTTAA